ncbi:ERC protein [Dirofilaria immitis]
MIVLQYQRDEIVMLLYMHENQAIMNFNFVPSSSKRYSGITFRPTSLYLPGTFCSISAGSNWNRQQSAQETPITQLFARYESNNCWQNGAAAVYRSRSAGPSNFTMNSNEAMNSVYSGDRRFAALQRQHKSLDGIQLDEYETNETRSLLPLNISTTNTDIISSQYSGPSLSNPTTTNAFFWKQPVNTYSYSGDAYGSPDTQFSRAYNLLKQDYEMAMQKLNATMSSIKTFWSPELKRERQLRKEETAKLAALQRQAGSQDGSRFQVFELETELENCRCELAEKDETIRLLMERTNAVTYHDGSSRMADLETRCNQLESLLEIREEQIRSMERHFSQLPISPSQAAKDQRIADLEDEIAMLRSERAQLPRDFTDKTITPHEINTLRMKMERSELELAQKIAELSAVQTRLQSATEAIEDLRKRVEVFRESSAAKEKHATLLQSDIEALRAKLETKNIQIEQKEKISERLEADLTVERNRVSDLCDSNRNYEQKINQLLVRIDTVESLLHDKENELEKVKQKLLTNPDVQKQEELQMQLDESNREKIRMQSLINELRHNAEKEKVQQLETFQAENRQLIATIESLQKELSDREILLESQSEKIGDLDRELITAERQCKNRAPQLSNDEELAEARKEIESLLRMVQTLEKEKTSIISHCKQLQSKLEDIHKSDTASTVGQTRPEFSTLSTEGSLKSRVEELEEALRESVSITAERELHVAQQKQLSQQLAAQLTECRRELNELRRHVKKSTSNEREEVLRSLEVEKRRHIEQLLQLKHEALVAAIAEKDAHIALLEQSRERPREEIETLRHHKDKLMEKLKEENERRSQLLNSTNLSVANDLSREGGLSAAATISVSASLAAPRQVITDQEDDAEALFFISLHHFYGFLQFIESARFEEPCLSMFVCFAIVHFIMNFEISQERLELPIYSLILLFLPSSAVKTVDVFGGIACNRRSLLRRKCHQYVELFQIFTSSQALVDIFFASLNADILGTSLMH